ncbi:MAG: NAD(P)H-dependent oxidoreductase [Desulfobacter sp.]|nr:MAG: NAD(P)H-dependent oxidoreductase [Desulfobacter sp.]
MFVLGIQGSPRKNGNSNYLLSSFLKECESHGARTQTIHAPDLAVQPCRELVVCEKKGFCPIKDEMETRGYGPVKQADVVVLASPIFFYNVSAQAKLFIDRCQMFWGRKYKMGLKDPDRFSRKGFLLSVAASGGKRLFEGVELTAKYFFDALSADFSGSLTYKKVEDAGAIIVRPELETEIREAAAHLLVPEMEKKQLIFLSSHGQCRSPMAAAFAKELSKGRLRVAAAGLGAGEAPLPEAVTAMASLGLDIKYKTALSWDEIRTALGERDRVVWLGRRDELPEGLTPWAVWEIPPAAAGEQERVRGARDLIQQQVSSLAGI